MTYNVTARRWDHGWELHVDGVGVTQCARLDQADRQVRDFVCTMLDVNAVADDVVVIPELEGITDEIREMRGLQDRASKLAHDADEARARVMRDMHEAGFSYSDIAGAVGVTKGRVSQLLSA